MKGNAEKSGCFYNSTWQKLEQSCFSVVHLSGTYLPMKFLSRCTTTELFVCVTVWAILFCWLVSLEMISYTMGNWEREMQWLHPWAGEQGSATLAVYSNSVVFMTIRKQFGESEVKQPIQSKIKLQLIQPSGNWPLKNVPDMSFWVRPGCDFTQSTPCLSFSAKKTICQSVTQTNCATNTKQPQYIAVVEQDTEALASKVFLILFVFHQPFQKIKTWCWWETKSSSPVVFINCLEPELYEKSNWKWVKTINRMIDVLAPICMLFQVVDRLGYGLCIHKCAFGLTFLPGILSASSSVTLAPTFNNKTAAHENAVPESCPQPSCFPSSSANREYWLKNFQ